MECHECSRFVDGLPSDRGARNHVENWGVNSPSFFFFFFYLPSFPFSGPTP